MFIFVCQLYIHRIQFFLAGLQILTPIYHPLRRCDCFLERPTRLDNLSIYTVHSQFVDFFPMPCFFSQSACGGSPVKIVRVSVLKARGIFKLSGYLVEVTILRNKVISLCHEFFRRSFFLFPRIVSFLYQPYVEESINRSPTSVHFFRVGFHSNFHPFGHTLPFWASMASGSLGFQ